MAVKGSKDTKQRSTETKAGLMGKESTKNDSTDSDKSEKLENLPKTSKENSEKRDNEKPLH
jgi:hypothetical protein